MYVLWRIIVKEFLQLRQDKKMIPVIFVAPIVQLMLFGFAVNTDVDRVGEVPDMAFEIRAYPDFSWSQSRRSTFRECPRKYFWHYYGSHNGWLDEASEARDSRDRAAGGDEA